MSYARALRQNEKQGSIYHIVDDTDTTISICGRRVGDYQPKNPMKDGRICDKCFDVKNAKRSRKKAS